MMDYKKEKEKCDILKNGKITPTFTYCYLSSPRDNNYIYNRYIDLEKIGMEYINSLNREEAVFLISYANEMYLENKWFSDLRIIAGNAKYKLEK